MRIGIFGGTFDPPHLGHLILASEARYQLTLDKLLFVLTPDPPHKQGREITPMPDRLAMLEAAIANNPLFEISRVEIDRPGPHYAVDTVNLLREVYPQAALIYLMGGDSLNDLPYDWHAPERFVAACDYIGVMHRPQEEVDIKQLEEAVPGLRSKLLFIPAPLLEIASSEIRQRARQQRPYQYYVPESVCGVINERNLYQS